MSTRNLATAAAKRLTTARDRVNAARQQLLDELRAADGYQNRDLNAEGLQKERSRRRSEARAKLQPGIDKLRQDIRGDLKTVADWAKTARPALPGDAAGQTAVWEGVKTRLDAGMPWQKVLAGADAQTALVMGQRLPAYLDAKQFRRHGDSLTAPFEGFDPATLNAAVDRRLEQVTQGDQQEALRLARESAASAAGCDTLLTNATAHAAGTPSNDLTAAIQAHFEQQAASVPLDQGESVGDVA